MRQFDESLTFSAVDLRKIATARSEAVQEWLSSITRMIDGGKFKPIRPVTIVPISQVKTGLRKLQSSQNIGKIIITLGPSETVMVERLSPLKTRSRTLLRSDVTYLITGGTRWLDRALAYWMIQEGAKNLVLPGRSSAFSAKLIGLLKQYENTDDAIFANTEFEDWEQAMGPKTFLDTFSEHRVKLGLPAVTIDLPAVKGVGMLIERGGLEQMIANTGLSITEDQFYTLIGGAITGPSSGLNTHGRSISAIFASKIDVDFLAWERFNPMAVMRRQRLDSGLANPSSNRSNKIQELLKDRSPELLMDVLSDKVSALTMIDREEITSNSSLLDYGLDNLFSLELRNWIRRSLDVDVALKDITSAKDLEALRDRILFPMKRKAFKAIHSQNRSLADLAANGGSISHASSPPVERLEDSRSQLPFHMFDEKKEELNLLKRAREGSLRALELPSQSMAELHEAMGLNETTF
ncbi:MAG: hypothetical protein Q9182_004672 [Xanthomendoza sp. 2 TL-2023]